MGYGLQSTGVWGREWNMGYWGMGYLGMGYRVCTGELGYGDCSIEYGVLGMECGVME